MPSLSIITVTFNSAKTLGDCLQSVAGQTVPVEHILVDGVSTDGTLEVAEEFSAHLSQVISEPDQGPYDAMNKGIAKARGDVVGILNADDFYPASEVLAWVTQAFEDPSTDACYGDLLYVDREEPNRRVRGWKSGRYSKSSFYNGWMPPHPTFFVRRKLYERFGGFRLDLGTAADYELMLRFLLKHEARAAYIPEILVHMRAAGLSNASLANRLHANRMDRKAWAVNSLSPWPWTLLAKPLRKMGQWIV